MSKRLVFLFLVFASFFLAACGKKLGTPYIWNLPPGIEPPPIPEDNLLTLEKVTLGEALFNDPALSANNVQACASCHRQTFAFAEPRERSVGSTGELHHRNASTLSNVAYNKTFTWAHPELKSLERQILIPLFSDRPVEMNVSGNEKKILQRLLNSPVYSQLFTKAFPNEKKPIHFDNIVKALASYVRSLVSFNSRFDRYAWYNDDSALTESELRGLNLFMSERLECRHCHGGFNFNASSTHAIRDSINSEFHNNGLLPEQLKPGSDLGAYDITGKKEDTAKFKAPTLRNIEYTAPYMHDGSIATLEDVIEFYVAGGFYPDTPNKSNFVHGFSLTDEEKSDLIAFLKSLSDEQFIQGN